MDTGQSWVRTQGEGGIRKPRTEVSEGTRLADSLISDFQPLERWSKFLLNPPGWCIVPERMAAWVNWYKEGLAFAMSNYSGIPGKLCMYFQNFLKRSKLREVFLWDFKTGKRGSIWEVLQPQSLIYPYFPHASGDLLDTPMIDGHAEPLLPPSSSLISFSVTWPHPPTVCEHHQQHLQATSKYIPNDGLHLWNVWCLTSSSPLTPTPPLPISSDRRNIHFLWKSYMLHKYMESKVKTCPSSPPSASLKQWAVHPLMKG